MRYWNGCYTRFNLAKGFSLFTWLSVGRCDARDTLWEELTFAFAPFLRSPYFSLVQSIDDIKQNGGEKRGLNNDYGQSW